MNEFTITLERDTPGIGVAGQRVTCALQPADVHDPTELPTYLAGFSPFGYRADEASGVVLVDKDQDKFRSFAEDDAFKPAVVKTSGQAAVAEVDPNTSLDDYKVIERAIGSFIPQQVQDQASNPNHDPRMAASRRCQNLLLLDREIDTFAGAAQGGLLGDPASWDSSVRTAVAGGQEWDIGGDPVKDLQTAIEKSHQPVSEVWMNQRVAHAFLRNPAVRDHMRQMLGDNAVQGAATEVARAGAGGRNVDFQITGLPPIKVVASKVKLATLDYIMPDVVVLTTTLPGPPTNGEEIASSWTFRRRGGSGVGFETREFFVPGRGTLGGTMVVVTMADIAKMTAPTAGGIITNVHS